MTTTTPFNPGGVYAPVGMHNKAVPRVFIAPARYIQGPGVIGEIPRYLSLVGSQRPAVLASRRSQNEEGGRLIAALRAMDVEVLVATFGGECSLEEIQVHCAALQGENIDVLLAVGGGKCVDAAKAIAYRLGVQVVIVPTLASNDAPCSALSVLYTAEGVTAGFESYPLSPAMVVVDTEIIAQAAERYLAAGMGDAMATWYEAKVCIDNVDARTPIGARPTLAACAMGETCAHTLYEHGLAASDAVRRSVIDDALERVVEANTLLSGLGFESGGIAAAHGVAQSYTNLPHVHAGYLHGEMVAMGLLTQLAMEGNVDETRKAAEFFSRIGLPVCLEQLSVERSDTVSLEVVSAAAVDFPLTHNMPFTVTPDVVKQAILDADSIGTRVAVDLGDLAYRRLQGL
ncbi:MAG: glycerol dehydrogenase [Proteobacteria bacterium]|nr:glycerol dehydrogenase [Pseudomonadota bacterium]